MSKKEFGYSNLNKFLNENFNKVATKCAIDSKTYTEIYDAGNGIIRVRVSKSEHGYKLRDLIIERKPSNWTKHVDITTMSFGIDEKENTPFIKWKAYAGEFTCNFIKC